MGSGRRVVQRAPAALLTETESAGHEPHEEGLWAANRLTAR